MKNDNSRKKLLLKKKKKKTLNDLAISSMLKISVFVDYMQFF